MRTALLIAGKDIRQRIRDRSVFLWGIVAPLGLAAIFSFVFNPISDTQFHAEYVVVNQDGGPVARGFLTALGAMEDQGIITVRAVDTVEEARAQVVVGSDAFADADAAQADAAFVIPAGFSDAVLAGKGTEMTVVGAKGSELGSQVAYAVAEGFAAELHYVEVAVKTALPTGVVPTPEQTGAMIQHAAAVPNPISLDDITAGTKQLDGTTQMTAGMAVFFVFFTVAFGVSGLLEERRLGTMTRLKAAPISRNSIILGKAITSFVLGIASMAVLVVATTLLLGADWGNPLGVALLIVSAVVAAMGVLAVVASVAKTQEQAGMFASIISLVFGLLGGTFFPVSQVGGLLSALSLATPQAWFMRGLGDLAGGEVSAVLPSVGVLLIFGVVSSAGAWVFLQKAVAR
jgi:ABC-2 type transport system permease protein